MKRWIAAIPLVLLAGFGVLGAGGLLYPEKPGFDEADQRPAPTRAFPLFGQDGEITFAPPSSGKTIAVNLFASWCAPCRAEHPLLTDLAAQFPDQVYGLAYKDTPEDTAKFLRELGDPYAAIGMDLDGQGGLDFGLTGVPETFVIDASGQVILHIRGQLDQSSMDKIASLLASRSGLES